MTSVKLNDSLLFETAHRILQNLLTVWQVTSDKTSIVCHGTGLYIYLAVRFGGALGSASASSGSALGFCRVLNLQ